jgi:hypothetical protein
LPSAIAGVLIFIAMVLSLIPHDMRLVDTA